MKTSIPISRGSMPMRRVDGLCEVVHDISANLQCRLDALPEGERDELMDAIGGSRGLFWDHAYKWAQSYHAAWEAMTDGERYVKTQHYLIDIDQYTREKFRLLLQYLPAYIGVQVVPVIETIEGDVSTTNPQFTGPTAETTHWGVYLRERDGQAIWQADAINEDTAMLLGRALASAHGVEIEPQLWKETKPAEVTASTPTERYRVAWEIDIEAAGPHAAALEALAIQRDPLSIATVFQVIKDGKTVARVDLSEKAE